MFESPFVQSAVAGGAMLLLFIAVFLIGKLVLDMLTHFDVEERLCRHDNPALAISIAGYYLGIVIIFIGALLGPSESLPADLLSVGGYSLLGIALLNVSRIINDKLLLPRFSVDKEILEDHNSGTGVVLFASYVASGLIIAGAIHGEGGGLHTALAFYAIGQVALFVFTRIYDHFTPYALHDEIANENIAAGVGFSGALVAIGIIIMKAVSGNFISWQHNLTSLALDVLLVFLFLLLTRLFFDKVILNGSDLNSEIAQDRNLGAGILEFSVAVGFSSILYFVM